MIHTVKCFGIVNKAEIDIFLELSCFSDIVIFSYTHSFMIKMKVLESNPRIRTPLKVKSAYRFPHHFLFFPKTLFSQVNIYFTMHRSMSNMQYWYCLVTRLCPTLSRPHGLWPTSLLCPWDFPGKNTRVDCRFLLQGPCHFWSLHCPNPR